MKDFTISGKYTDYYEVQSDDGILQYKALENPIKQLAVQYCKCLEYSIAQGKDPRQTRFHLSGEIDRFISQAPKDAQRCFYQTYIHEMNAAMAIMDSTTSKPEESPNLSKDIISKSWFWGLIALVIVLAIYVMF